MEELTPFHQRKVVDTIIKVSWTIYISPYLTVGL